MALIKYYMYYYASNKINLKVAYNIQGLTQRIYFQAEGDVND